MLRTQVQRIAVYVLILIIGLIAFEVKVTTIANVGIVAVFFYFLRGMKRE